MSRAARPPQIPARHGLDASCVALPAGPWPTVLDFLAERLPLVARHAWAERLQRGDVLDEQGHAVPPGAAYRPHSRLFYYRDSGPEPEPAESETLLYQDAQLVVVDKPHFMPVLPTGPWVRRSLLVRLRQRLGLPQLSPVHRIDRETAGLVVFSVQAAQRNAYQALFRQRQVIKRYEALAAGQPALDWPRWHRSRLAPVPGIFTQQEVPGEPNSETWMECMETYGTLARYGLLPTSGRRHQLRVHMAALGLPLLGDRYYPTLCPPNAADDTTLPLQLLASGLEFTDPVTGQPRQFETRRRLLPLAEAAAQLAKRREAGRSA